MRICALKDEDIPRVVRAWNQALKHHPMTEERFRKVVVEDPNYESGSAVFAEGRDQQVLGLAAVVLRRTVEGKDGGGMEGQFSWGYLKAFFTLQDAPAWDAAGALLAAAEAYCTQAGKDRLVVTTYAGPYFWPGVDLRYEWLREALTGHGYRDIYTIEDVAIDLRLPLVEETYQRVCAGLPAEVSVVAWEPSLLPAMKAFVTEGNTPYWFPRGWEKGLSVPHSNVFILRKGEEVLGWAQYSPGAPRSGFGPILVLPRVRGSNYGARLLLECMVRAREAGATQMTAGWANTGFYTRHGWHIARRYAVLTKELAG